MLVGLAHDLVRRHDSSRCTSTRNFLRLPHGAAIGRMRGPGSCCRTQPRHNSRRGTSLNGSDYIGPDTIPKFESEAGIQVTYNVYASNEVLGRSCSPADRAMTLSSRRRARSRHGKSQPGSTSRSTRPNCRIGRTSIRGILELVAAADPGNAHGVPYLWSEPGSATTRRRCVLHRVTPHRWGVWR